MRILTNQKYSILIIFVSAGHEGPNYSKFDEHVVWDQFSASVFRFCAFVAESEDSSNNSLFTGAGW